MSSSLLANRCLIDYSYRKMLVFWLIAALLMDLESLNSNASFVRFEQFPLTTIEPEFGHINPRLLGVFFVEEKKKVNWQRKRVN
ncbi:hypothetical protein KQX54_010986 [Cotesia glomerata]|uniref:Uncharacterized protein n=1 Tax=Cotesia glomerata TaxID=32391 RepID=A0AAV7I7F7_COTGL|nr:hypothetical protein KQX54_010986 [Cotesia glomerata]